MEPRIYTLPPERIGEATDIYFARTKRILEARGLTDRVVRMEVHSYRFPQGYEWAVFAGLEEALALLRGRDLTVYAMPEGTLFKPGEPVMILEGAYYEMADLETPLLGILRHYTSVATKAARIKRLAGDRTVLFFGLRAAHPALAPMLDRAAYIGGLDGVSGVLAEEYLGLKPRGTMPHALIILMGDQKEAWQAFDEVVEPEVPRIALVDTFCDERMEALMAAKLLGDKLHGVRLDTPSSRRGDIKAIIEEVRWTLDIHGYRHVKIYVSGGIGEKEVVRLRDVADGFGVGTTIAFPRSIDLSMDIVEIREKDEWRPFTKRGKLPGAKQVYRRRPGLNDTVTLLKAQGPQDAVPLLSKIMEKGVLKTRLPSLEEIHRYVLKQLSEVPEPQPV